MTEIYHPVNISVAADTKAASSSDPTLAFEIDELNKLHRAFVALDTPNQVPPPPAPVNPKRSVQINKMRESGNASYKKGAYGDAIKMYDLAIRMATERPAWEASGLVREELSALYNNRAQSWMSQQMWPEAANDAELSVELKRVGNIKGWWRRGQCLKEMGRFEDARDWVRSGLEFEKAGPDKQNIGELETLRRDLQNTLGAS